MGMTVKQLYDEINEAISEGDIGWDTQITYDAHSDKRYGDLYGVSIECRGCEFRLHGGVNV